MAFTQHISDFYGVLTSSVVEHVFYPWSDEKQRLCNIGVCCFSAKHTALIEGGHTITMVKRESIHTINDPQSTTQKTED